MALVDLNKNELAALTSALSNYLDGHQMAQDDEDEPVLDDIYDRLVAANG